MKFAFRLSLLPLLLLTLTNITFGQVTDAGIDTLTKHLNWYAAKKSSPKLFAHLDKTVYVNNETIWFTTYLLDFGPNLIKHQILAVTLVNNNDQKIAVERKFPMAGGISYGNLIIPDTIPPGNYSLVAQTNMMDSDGKPNALFIQDITIKSATQSLFNADMVLDTLYKDPANSRVLINVRGERGPLEGAAINYVLGKDKKTRISGDAKTNVLGSYILTIPKASINAMQHNLEVQLKFGKETKALRLNLPVKKTELDVKFYAEGGHLIAGLVNRVGWEVKTPGGAAIKTRGTLYLNNKPVDTIETDSYGMGQFTITPLPQSTYTLKLWQGEKDDAVYYLPAVLPDGLTLRIADALAEDTIKAKLQTMRPGNYTMMVHNYKQIFLTTNFNVNRAGRNLKIDLADVPRGINAITILDSLYRPVAERLFFAHYNQKPAIDISIDDNLPKPRQKVNVKLKLNGLDTKNALGLVSVAVVQDNRFEIKKSNNIESYVYLQNELDNLPLKENLMGKADLDRQYLNELLLIRGWSKYNWQEMIATTPADTVKKFNDLAFSGTVIHFTDSLKKAVGVVMMKDTSYVSVINTDNRGHFNLTSDDIYKRSDKSIKLIVSGNSDEYFIKVKDPYLAVEKLIAKSIEPFVFDQQINNDTREFLLTGLKVTNLREVKIKGAGDDNSLYASRGWGTNACGDYICRNHILNCQNHRGELDNRAPKTGERVYSDGRMITYAGCTIPEIKPGMTLFDGVSFPKQYYGSDYAVENSTVPDYISTIYWKHSVKLKAGEEATLSFYTSDITGKFRIVVQGLTSEDVVYGETTFNVVKKTP